MRTSLAERQRIIASAMTPRWVHIYVNGKPLASAPMTFPQLEAALAGVTEAQVQEVGESVFVNIMAMEA